MSFMDKYPTKKDCTEIESDSKRKLADAIASAIRESVTMRGKFPKTYGEVPCNEEAIDIIKKEIMYTPLADLIERIDDGFNCSLNDILAKVMSRLSTDPQIGPIAEQLDLLHQEEQRRFEESDGYVKMRELWARALKGDETVSETINELQNQYGHVSAKELEDGTVLLHLQRNFRGKLILNQFDYKVLICDGEIKVDIPEVPKDHAQAELI